MLQTAEKTIIQSSIPIIFSITARTYNLKQTKTTMNKVKQTHTAMISG